MGQTDFTAALLDPEKPVPEGLVDPQGRPAGKRFDVYRNNVTSSLIAALETGFPVLQKLLGESSFKTLATLFLRAHPPTSGALQRYGDAMPGFLAGFKPLASLPYLADIARLELAIRTSYHAADHHPLDPAGLDPEAMMALTPRLAPATHILTSPYPIYSIWRMNMVAGAPKPAPVSEDVLITRVNFDPTPHLLPPGGRQFAEALDGCTPIAAAIEAAMIAAPRADIAGLLTLFLSSQALTLPTEKVQ